MSDLSDARVLDVDDLCVGYPMPSGEREQVVHHVSISVSRGETVGLVGESGSGKSTTARATVRLLPPHTDLLGTVRTCGVDVLAANDAALRDLRARHVAYVHQDPRASLNPMRSIGDLVTERLVHGLGATHDSAAHAVVDLMGSLGLPRPAELMRRSPHELSGGMLQRVVIAGCLSADPSLLIADEATSALDVTSQAEVLALVRQQQVDRGLALLFITHDLHLAAAYCDRVYVLREGQLVERLVGSDLFSAAEHPYTRELLAATPVLTAPAPRRSES